MSVDTPTPSTARSRAAATRDLDAGGGWLTFAGILLLIVGVMNFIGGIAAIDNANFFVHNARYVFGDLNTWGWFNVVFGVVQVFAALAIWRGAPWGRWFGVACASGNAILQMVWIPSYPILAMTILTLGPNALKLPE